jgi:hypothetical protein
MNNTNDVAYPWDDEIMVEVRQRKAQLLEIYGGIEGLHKHMDEERPLMEKEGWKFVDIDELRKKNYCRQMAESL